MIEELSRFSCLEPEVKRWLVTRVMDQRFDKGDKIFSQETPCDRFFILYAGYAKMIRETPAQDHILVGLMGKNETPGEAGLIAGVYPANGFAQTRVRMLSLSRADYLELRERSPVFMKSCADTLAHRTRYFLDRLKISGEISVELRLLRFLEELARSFGRTDGARIWLPFGLSRKDLAAIMVCRIETAIRLARKLEIENVLHFEKSQTWIDQKFFERGAVAPTTVDSATATASGCC